MLDLKNKINKNITVQVSPLLYELDEYDHHLIPEFAESGIQTPKYLGQS